MHPMRKENSKKHAIFIRELKKIVDCNLKFCAISDKDMPQCFKEIPNSSFHYIQNNIDHNKSY